MSNTTCASVRDFGVCSSRSGCEWSCVQAGGCVCQDNASTLIIIIVCSLFGFALLGICLCCCYYMQYGNPDNNPLSTIIPCVLCEDAPLQNRMFVDEYGRGVGVATIDRDGNVVMMNSGPPQSDPYMDRGVMLPPRGQNRWIARQGRNPRHRKFYPPSGPGYPSPSFSAGPPDQEDDIFNPRHPPLREEFRVAPDGLSVVQTRFADGRVAYSTGTQEELTHDDDEDYDDDADGGENNYMNRGVILEDDGFDDNDGSHQQRRRQPRHNNYRQQPKPAFGGVNIINNNNEPFYESQSGDSRGFRISRSMETGGDDTASSRTTASSTHGRRSAPPPPAHLLRGSMQRSGSGKHVQFQE